MTILTVLGLKKTLGAQEVLRGVELRIEAGEKVGLVGRNGEGKTTLLRLIEAEETPDSGSIQISRNVRLGHVAQRPEFAPGVTARQYVTTGLDEVHAVEAELHRVGDAMAHASGAELDALVKHHGELTSRMEALGGWETERRVEIVLAGIGLPPALWDREAATFSGGEKSRTALAHELVAVPELLLLDEPTNHLDLSGIEWLEEYLRTLPSGVLMVSHDRRLLDRVADSIVELERGVLTRYPGNYAKYLDLKAERYRSSLRAYEEQQDFIRKEDVFIRTHLGSQRTGEAKGRQRKLESLVRLQRPFLDVRRPVIHMQKDVDRGGELIFEAEDLAVGYGGKAVVSNVQLRVSRGDRIGIVGPNGSGKSTLLRALAGRLTPLSGMLERGYKAVAGYYDQDTSELDPNGTPYFEIRKRHAKMTDEEIRNHLARFLFRGNDIDLPVRGLSGGERARLALAKLVLTQISWLALDEPTNHLDLAGRTALEEFLGEFKGVLVFVSHDRAFLDVLSNRIVDVKDGRVRDFRGNYSEYRAKVASETTAALAAKEDKKREQVVRQRAESNRRESPAARQKSSPTPTSSPAKPRNPWKLDKLETAIMALETERKTLLDDLGSEEVWRNPARLQEAQVRLAELERDLERKNLEWESLI